MSEEITFPSVNPLTQEDLNEVLSWTPKVMPDSPTAMGWSARKTKLYQWKGYEKLFQLIANGRENLSKLSSSMEAYKEQADREESTYEEWRLQADTDIKALQAQAFGNSVYIYTGKDPGISADEFYEKYTFVRHDGVSYVRAYKAEGVAVYSSCGDGSTTLLKYDGKSITFTDSEFSKVSGTAVCLEW